MNLVVAKCLDGSCHVFRDADLLPLCRGNVVRAGNPAVDDEDDVCETCDAEMWKLISN